MRRLRFLLPLLTAVSLLLPQVSTLAQTATPTPDYRAVVEVGMVQIMAGPTPDPSTGWLVCDGSSIDRTTYANLFAVIGTTFGDGDGSTTFDLPDLRGRQVIGAGQGTGLTLRTLGQIFGEELHYQTTAELASHNHGVTDPGHVHNSVVSIVNPASNRALVSSGGTQLVNPNTNTGNSVTGISINNTGTGEGMNVIEPSTVMNFVIWSGAVELNVGAAPAEDIVITVVVVFPTHTPTPTPTPTLTPTTGPSPTPTPTLTPTGISPYEAVTTINGQPVVFEYRIGPGDAAVFGTTFLIVGLIIYALWMQIKRRRG